MFFKKNKIFVLLLVGLLACSFLVACGADEKPADNNTEEGQDVAVDGDKKGILVVSFGTSYEDTRKVTIEAVEEKIAATFPDYEARRAFTSNIIIKKLKERDNLDIDTPTEALEKMKKDGFAEVIVQPLHIMPGFEYDDVVAVVEEFKDDFEKITMGRPLLYKSDDYEDVAKALKQQLPENLSKDHAVVFMGHGSDHPANSTYSLLDGVLKDEGINAFVGTVEGYPEIDQIADRLKNANIKEVTLMPFMLVAGDHASNDMAGDEEDSWKNILKKEGFTVNIYLHGLGENTEIQDLYLERVQDCIDGNPLGADEE